MTEEQKKQVAAFRFGVIHDLVNRMDMDRGEPERLIREKCSRKWSIPFSAKTYIGRTTILRWMRRYKSSGPGSSPSILPNGAIKARAGPWMKRRCSRWSTCGGSFHG